MQLKFQENGTFGYYHCYCIPKLRELLLIENRINSGRKTPGKLWTYCSCEFCPFFVYVVFVHTPITHKTQSILTEEPPASLLCLASAPLCPDSFAFLFVLTNLCSPTLAPLFHCCTNLQTWRETNLFWETNYKCTPRSIQDDDDDHWLCFW